MRSLSDTGHIEAASRPAGRPLKCVFLKNEDLYCGIKKNRDFLNSVAFFGLTGYNRLKPHIRFGYGSVTLTLSVWFGVGFGYFCVLYQFFFPSPCQLRGLKALFFG